VFLIGCVRQEREGELTQAERNAMKRLTPKLVAGYREATREIVMAAKTARTVKKRRM